MPTSISAKSITAGQQARFRLGTNFYRRTLQRHDGNLRALECELKKLRIFFRVGSDASLRGGSLDTEK